MDHERNTATLSRGKRDLSFISFIRAKQSLVNEASFRLKANHALQKNELLKNHRYCDVFCWKMDKRPSTNRVRTSSVMFIAVVPRDYSMFDQQFGGLPKTKSCFCQHILQSFHSLQNQTFSGELMDAN